jgi:RHS repeat-associated protein
MAGYSSNRTMTWGYYPDGTLVASHTYTYDANGNKAQDVAKKMNADNHSAYLDSTSDYTYDPADRIAKVTKTGNGASTDTYVHDDNANVISQTVKGTSTSYAYDRNRLLSATASGTTFSYNYDPFGRQESVTSGGQVVERSVYDGFDHVVESQKMDDTGALKSTKYTFDPLDRTASKTADGKTTDFNYLGLSSEVLTEEVSGALTKSYQYSPWGERLSQIKHNSDGTTEDGYYGYNSHTDVETLTDNNGDTKATYGYTAYGSDDDLEFTGIDKPDAADPTKEAYNPYRYNAKRWDAQSGTYDMDFRNYSPGLNRFTTRDMYNGALADMSLGADPFTGNRYAFTGGNPTTFIEADGHESCYPNYCSGSNGTYGTYQPSKDPAASNGYTEDQKKGQDLASTEDRVYDKEEPTDRDRDVLNQMYWVKLGTWVQDWDNAYDLLSHWLGNSGDPYEVDPEAMMRDIPRFRRDVTRYLEGARAEGNATFDSGWLRTRADEEDGESSLDWYYALNNFQFRVTGTNQRKFGTTYTVQVRKRYDWGVPSEHRNDLKQSFLWVDVDVQQAEVAHLHTVGLAQDFDVYGSATMRGMP